MEEPDVVSASKGFLFEDKPFQIQTYVHVVLLGFDREKFSEKEFQDMLQSSMSVRKIHAIETGTLMNVEYLVSFTVEHRDSVTAVENGIIKGLLGGQHKRYLVVDVERSGLEKILDDIEQEINKERTAYRHTVFVMNPRLERLKTGLGGQLDDAIRKNANQNDDVRYRYNYYGSAVDSAVWSSYGRFLYIDIQASGNLYGEFEDLQGTVLRESFPSVRDEDAVLKGKLQHLIVSGVRHIFLPDICREENRPSKFLLIPFFIFKNHASVLHKNLVYDNKNFDLDVNAIVRRLQNIQIPGSTIKVVFGIYDLKSHPHIAMSLSKAREHRNGALHFMENSFMVDRQTRAVTNGKKLLGELQHAVDHLTEDLLLEVGGQEDLLSSFFGDQFKGSNEKRLSHQLRIFPVYVFSLAGRNAEDLFFHNGKLNFANGVGSVVVQSGYKTARTPHFVENNPVMMNPSRVEGEVMESIVTGLGNVAPTHLYWNDLWNKTSKNYLWSTGNTLSGSFSNKNYLDVAEYVSENIIRASLIVKIHHCIKKANEILALVSSFERKFNKHLVSPLVTSDFAQTLQHGNLIESTAANVKLDIENFGNSLDYLKAIFAENSRQRKTELFELANELPRIIDSIYNKSYHELEQVSSKLLCCKWQARKNPSSSYTSVFIGGFILMFLMFAIGAIVVSERKKQ